MENLIEENERIKSNKLYEKLAGLPPECYELFLAQLVKVARSSNEEELLYMSDVLLRFAREKKIEGADRIMVETTVEEIFPILNTRNPERIKELVSSKYSSVLESLEDIRGDSDGETVEKCLFWDRFLTGSKIIKNENLDS